MNHLEGRPINATTYKTHGCRCDGCRLAANKYQRKLRSNRDGALWRVNNKQNSLALRWMRENHPDVMRELLGASYEELGIERRKPGRPGGKAA